MTHAKSSRRGAAKKRGRGGWRDRFLAELAQTSNVAASARKAKMAVSTVYKARRCEPDFARAWFEALSEGYDNLELDLLARLRQGELDGGAKAKARRKFDNATAFRLLAAHRETVKKERGRNDYEHEDAILASIDAKLERMRQRTEAAARQAREESSSQIAEPPAAGHGDDGAA